MYCNIGIATFALSILLLNIYVGFMLVWNCCIVGIEWDIFVAIFLYEAMIMGQ